jgi:Protein of unknown function (DUF1569)
MPVNTAKVKDRRDIRYGSFAELLADAERLSSGNVRVLGNWSAGQIFQHLANAFNGSIDGFHEKLPWAMRMMARLFKKKLISGGMPAGMTVPKKLAEQVMPEPTSTEQGLENLRAAVARLDRDPHRAEHPAFGTISNDEWNQIHLGHASLHMSFLCAQP